MPNFIASSLKELSFPFGNDKVKFLWQANGRNERLIYTKNEEESFFLVVKPGKNGIVAKGEKLTKPAKVGLLQEALELFKEQNCNGIISQAFAVKKTNLTKKVIEILSLEEFAPAFCELKDKFDQIFIEIGFGSGRHLLYQAKNNPNALVIGIEVYKPSIEQVAKLARANALENVRLINTDARLLLSLVGSNLVDRVFLHFPVPWDKAEHRRVVSSAFALECERILKVGGKFELRTDSKEYCDFSLSKFLEPTNSKIEAFKNRNLEITSKYEDRWRRQDKDIYDVIYTCEVESGESVLAGDFGFKEKTSVKNIIKNFKNFIIKKEDHFLHFEEIYTINEGEILLKVAFGAFNKPEQCFIKISDEKSEYFIKKPILIRENLAAHELLKEYLADARDN